MKNLKNDNKYFNIWDYRQACSLIEVDPQMALIKLEQYLEKYPEDFSAYHAYINVLTILGKFDKAERMIDYCEELVKDNSHFANLFEKVKKVKVNIFFDKLKLYCFKEKYYELYQLFLDNYDYPEIKKLGNVKFFCMNKLGMLTIKREDTDAYIYKQMIDYSENDFREHIQKHDSSSLLNCDFRDNMISSSVFVPDFPLDKVISEIKNNLYLENCLYYGFYTNIYTFKYNECGRVDNKLTDYIEVVCFHNTKDIITLYPIPKRGNLPYVDLNYLVDKKEETNKVKTKRMSQIDKFNKRYNRN